MGASEQAAGGPSAGGLRALSGHPLHPLQRALPGQTCRSTVGSGGPNLPSQRTQVVGPSEMTEIAELGSSSSDPEIDLEIDTGISPRRRGNSQLRPLPLHSALPRALRAALPPEEFRGSAQAFPFIEEVTAMLAAAPGNVDKTETQPQGEIMTVEGAQGGLPELEEIEKGVCKHTCSPHNAPDTVAGPIEVSTTTRSRPRERTQTMIPNTPTSKASHRQPQSAEKRGGGRRGGRDNDLAGTAIGPGITQQPDQNAQGQTGDMEKKCTRGVERERAWERWEGAREGPETHDGQSHCHQRFDLRQGRGQVRTPPEEICYTGEAEGAANQLTPARTDSGELGNGEVQNELAMEAVLVMVENAMEPGWQPEGQDMWETTTQTST